MKIWSVTLIILLGATYITGCDDNTSGSIKASLSAYALKKNNKANSLLVDSITYALADSTVYYNHFLNLLAERSESLSKIARLRTSLARYHMNTFLSDNMKDGYSTEKTTIEVDKSLQELQQNERQWNVVNDSMDIMLNAIHTTDTTKKVFYTVSFSLNEVIKNKKFTQNKKAILNKEDFKVVIYE